MRGEAGVPGRGRTRGRLAAGLAGAAGPRRRRPSVPGTRAEPGARPRHRAQPAATDTVAGTHLAAYALGGGQGLVLGVAAAAAREPADHTVAGVAVVLLSLLTGDRTRGGAAGGARPALVRLLLGAAPAEVAPLLGDERWTVVHARPTRGTARPVAASALGAALGSAAGRRGRRDAYGSCCRPTGEIDRAARLDPGRERRRRPARISPPPTPQAARALRRARPPAVPLARHARTPGLAELVPPDEAATHARSLLAPLADSPALAETLRAWLSLHGSWDRTAVALGVHRNTVRQRIARCAALLGVDLDDADVRMELWFALRYV